SSVHTVTARGAPWPQRSRWCPAPAGGSGEQAERVPGRIEEHAHVLLRLLLGTPGTALQGPRGRRGKVRHVQVQVLAGQLLPGPGRPHRRRPAPLELHVQRPPAGTHLRPPGLLRLAGAGRFARGDRTTEQSGVERRELAGRRCPDGHRCPLDPRGCRPHSATVTPVAPAVLPESAASAVRRTTVRVSTKVSTAVAASSHNPIA